jgi:UDP-3-O-[3-hydroxymyristoyl] glucosamine N-acyltransferase
MKRTLGELADFLEGELKGPAHLVIEGIAAIDQATPRDISFISQGRYVQWAEQSRAAAFIVGRQWADLPRPLIIVSHPYLAYARVAALFAPPPRRFPGLSPLAVVGRDVAMGQDVSVAPLVYIGDGVRLGDRVTLMPGCVIGPEVEIGADTWLFPNVTVLEHCRLGARVIIHSGTVIGSDGFGFVPTPSGNLKIPQLGRVVIEDEVEIGANCTIDRAALGETRVAAGAKIDNLVHLAHNVVVGEHSLLAAQVGIAGSTKLGQRVALGGQVGLVGHIDVGDGVQIGAQSGVPNSIKSGQIVLGCPARPHKEFLKLNAYYSRLPEIFQRLKQLEAQVAQLKSPPTTEPES